MMRFAILAVVVLAACTSDKKAAIDAPPMVAHDAAPHDAAIDARLDASHLDSAPSAIDVVACAGGEKGPITTAVNSFVYSPSTLTVAVGDTVKFVMVSEHNVVADIGVDPKLTVGFSETKCLKFKVAGAYKFHCGPHSFKGTVTVQ